MISLPGLYQTTAFGLTGLVTLDMLSHMKGPLRRPINLIFLDTLYHFDETLDLVDRVRSRYPDIIIHVYKPDGCSSAADFETMHGYNLWETKDDLYDYLAKVEPAQRAYSELNVRAVLTGRRRSQGGKRGDLDIIQVDDAGLIKVNPLANWTFKQVQEYVRKHNVPYNELLDFGYKSIGDWHSTRFVSFFTFHFFFLAGPPPCTNRLISPVLEGEDERSGRWKGTSKTECGIHNDRSKYAEFLLQQELKKKEEALADALRQVESEQAALI